MSQPPLSKAEEEQLKNKLLHISLAGMCDPAADPLVYNIQRRFGGPAAAFSRASHSASEALEDMRPLIPCASLADCSETCVHRFVCEVRHSPPEPEIQIFSDTSAASKQLEDLATKLATPAEEE